MSKSVKNGIIWVGLGESVVSGEVAGDMYVVSKESLKVLEKSMGEKRVQIVQKGDGVVEEEVPPEKRDTYVLNDEEAAEIVRLCMFLESHFNEPQDVEWSIDAEKPFPQNIYLLQTRPVVGVKVQKPKADIDQVMDSLLKKFS
jgi:pyruvate,water dikinase